MSVAGKSYAEIERGLRQILAQVLVARMFGDEIEYQTGNPLDNIERIATELLD